MSTITSETPAGNSAGRSHAKACPRCHSLRPWGGASWCPDCGYYPAVDKNSGSSWADDLPEAPQEVVADDRSALESIPGWFWLMIAGVVAIGGFSIAIRLNYPEDDGPRGTIATAMLFIGFLVMAVAHTIAGVIAMKSDRRLNVYDILISWFAVWQPTIIQLPKRCERVLAMVWGTFAMIAAMTIIGGIDYGAPFRGHEGVDIKPMNVVGTVAAAAASQAQQQGDPNASLGEALGDLQQQVDQANGGMIPGGGAPASMTDALNGIGDVPGDLQNLEGSLANADGLLNGGLENLTEEEAQTAQKRTLESYIYGVVTDRNSVPTSLLFAANTQGKDQHVAEIATKDLDRDIFRKIAMRLYKETQRTPEVESTRKAVWVKPVLTCRLTFFGFTESGELVDPEFDAIVVKQRGMFQK